MPMPTDDDVPSMEEIAGMADQQTPVDDAGSYGDERVDSAAATEADGTEEFLDEDAAGPVGGGAAPAVRRPAPAEHSRDVTIALQQARDELRGAKAELERERQEKAEWNRRVAEVQNQRAREAAQEAQRLEEEAANPEPDKITDPQAWKIWDLERKLKAVAGGAEQQQQVSIEDRQRQIVARIYDESDRMEIKFKADNPDYQPAFDYLIAHLITFFRAQGYADNEILGERGLLVETRDKFLHRRLNVLPGGAYTWKSHPIADLYEMSKKLGYKPAAAGAAAAPAPAGVRRPAGRAPAPGAAGAAAAAAGARASAGAGGRPGGGGGRELSYRELATMSEEEIAALVFGGRAREVDRAMGSPR